MNINLNLLCRGAAKLSLLLLLLGIPTEAQERVIELPAYGMKEVTEITEVKVKDTSVIHGKSFVAGDDWLNGLSVRVKNTSGKPIAFLRLNLRFPEAHYKDGSLAGKIEFGREPDKTHVPGNLELINFEDSIELVLKEDKYNELREFIRQRSPGIAISKVIIHVGTVIFADGTLWSNGFFFRRSDPNNPRKWIPVSQ
jgi:hypothetical protein